ncbi:recombinase family protein [Xanthomonas perforans]|uniref:recombinase family protein n=1 Tax=Xanthomonas perforans TaxID=442694 RepID=UPI003CCECA57
MVYVHKPKRFGYAYDDGVVLLPEQLHHLAAASCCDIAVDRSDASPNPQQRPQLQATLRLMRTGDTLVVPCLEILTRQLPDLVRLCDLLCDGGLTIESVVDAIPKAATATAPFMESVAVLAEVQRRISRQRAAGVRTRARRAAAPATPARPVGRNGGRPPSLTTDQISTATALLQQPEMTVTAVAKALGVSRNTIYKHVPRPVGGAGT